MKREEKKYCKCYMQRSLAILSSHWKPVIIYTLMNRKARFGQLHALIENISRKVLTSDLRELEQDGVVKREEFKEIPPRVEYSLTKKGKDLLPIMKSLVQWYAVYNNEETEKVSAVSDSNFT